MTDAGLRASREPLASVYDTALLDLDGVVYIGGTAIEGAPEALRKAQADGMRLAYVTNNAFRTPAAVAALLSSLGAPAEPADVVTSAQAAARMLAERLPAGAPVLVVGGMGLRLAVRERGLRPVSTAAEKPVAVVQGYWPTLSYSALLEGGMAVAAGALFVATNADITLPNRRGVGPGNGSLVRVIANATGVEPLVAGKPEPPMHTETMIRTGAKHPLIVGDRLDTDILAAHNVGTDSLLVLTGVTSPVGAILAPPDQRPTYLAEDLTGLLEPHPPVETTRDGTSACGGWTASWQADRLDLAGSGKRIDGLRALCAAAWSGPAPSRDAAEAAIQRLDQAS